MRNISLYSFIYIVLIGHTCEMRNIFLYAFYMYSIYLLIGHVCEMRYISLYSVFTYRSCMHTYLLPFELLQSFLIYIYIFVGFIQAAPSGAPSTKPRRRGLCFFALTFLCIISRIPPHRLSVWFVEPHAFSNAFDLCAPILLPPNQVVLYARISHERKKNQILRR